MTALRRHPTSIRTDDRVEVGAGATWGAILAALSRGRSSRP